MSAAICRSSTAVSLPLEKGVIMMSTPFAASKTWLPSAAAAGGKDIPARDVAMIKNDEQEEGGGEKTTPGSKLDIWTSIHATKAKEPKGEPYVHPLTRRSSSLMSQRSLAICTESLGSETGSDDFFSSDDDDDMEHSWFSTRPNKQVVQQQVEYDHHDDEEEEEEEEEETDEFVGMRRKEQDTVNYHCSISRRPPCRSFPPPLPSISRRDGPCFQMRPHRRDGRLVVEAVAVPSQNYLHAERQDGRLLLSFINTTTRQSSTNTASDILTGLASQQTPVEEQEQVVEDEEEVMELEDQEEEEEEEEEEEVEVVDRGTVVEVKVSTQPQQQSGGSATMKVHRSSIVINKFVSCTSSQLNDKENDQNAVNGPSDDYAISAGPPTPGRRSTNTTTTAAAAAVAASSLSTLPADGNQPSFDNKLLFTSKRRNREELLRDMRRCSQLRKPLFIWEPTCIATSS